MLFRSWFGTLPSNVQDTLIATPTFSAVNASSVPLDCIGSVQFSVGFPNESWQTTHKWYVIKNLPYAALFGMNFITKHRGIVDTDHGHFQLRPYGQSKFKVL